MTCLQSVGYFPTKDPIEEMLYNAMLDLVSQISLIVSHFLYDSMTCQILYAEIFFNKIRSWAMKN